MPVTIDNQEISLSGVKGIAISTIQPDPNSDAYIRTIQVYVDDASVVNRRPVVTLVLSGGSQVTHDTSAISIAAPATGF